MWTGQRRATGWVDQPVVLEINTWVWLNELSARHGRRVDLGSIPAQAWDAALLPGVDAVWLMGVWARSPAGAVIARSEPGVRSGLARALTDLSDEDIVGSPYSVRSYTVDQRLGGEVGLAAAREDLGRRGIKLLLDYVPNHVARDHAWASTNPGYLVQASPEHAATQPDDFVQINDIFVALGRDPYFPPWTDVVQLNAFDQGLRDATATTLADIGDRADGVRCDMAMLLLNDVFASTWGRLVGEPPEADFWEPVITSVRNIHPDFLFVAEAYWDMELQLLEQGFDYCYDKRLFDAVAACDAPGLRAHLATDVARQRRMMRFLENHDEERAAARLSGPLLRTAAVAVTTVPGALLLYEGQAEGLTERPPVQLARRPEQFADDDLRSFYEQLLSWLDRSDLRAGTWRLLDVEPVAAGAELDCLAAWSWESPDQHHVVVVNLSPEQCSARVRLPWTHRDAPFVASEALTEARYEHDAADVAANGLYVRLDGGHFHILSV